MVYTAIFFVTYTHSNEIAQRQRMTKDKNTEMEPIGEQSHCGGQDEILMRWAETYLPYYLLQIVEPAVLVWILNTMVCGSCFDFVTLHPLLPQLLSLVPTNPCEPPAPHTQTDSHTTPHHTWVTAAWLDITHFTFNCDNKFPVHGSRPELPSRSELKIESVFFFRKKRWPKTIVPARWVWFSIIFFQKWDFLEFFFSKKKQTNSDILC